MAIGFVVLVALLAGTLVTGCPPVLPSAADLIELRDRIDAEAAALPSCPGIQRTPEQTHPAEIDWVTRRIRLRHATGQPMWLPASVDLSAREKRMLPGGPILASVGCAVATG